MIINKATGEKMKTKALSLSTILGFLGLLIIMHTMKAQGATTNISCSTAFGAKKFTILNNHISFQKEELGGANRSISSSEIGGIHTQKINAGFTKTLYIEGNKHFIRIHNVNAFSELEDYLSITGSKGHVMTYPLKCLSV
jgi:hypothetical protein